jgi:hypothetical protein
MPKTARQLDREIADALGGGSASTSARYTIHGAKRGINEVEYAATPADADRIARELAKKDFLVTVFTRDPRTQETRVVLHSNRKDGHMVFTSMDENFAGTERRPRARPRRPR